MPKGLIAPEESPLSAALREFAEETGHHPRGEFFPVGKKAAGRQNCPRVGCSGRLGYSRP